MLTVNQLSFSYNNSENVLNHLSFSLGKGVHSIIGLNGSGKTTLLNLIVGLLPVKKSTIQYKTFSKIRRYTAYVPYDNFFYSHLTGREYLSLFKGNSTNIEQWCKALNIDLDAYISTYSSGTKKKLAILSGIKQEKDIYIFDEPFNGLDIESRYIILELLKQLKQKGKIILITSHIIDILNEISDDYYLLADSKIKRIYAKNEFNLLEQELMQMVNDKIKI